MKTLFAAALIAALTGVTTSPVLAADPTEIRDPYEGKISCRFLDDAEGQRVRCDLTDYRSSIQHRKPAECAATFAGAFVLRPTGKGEALCTDDISYDASFPTIEKNTSVTHFGITCTAEYSGFHCTNPEGGKIRMSMAKQHFQ